MFTGIVEELGSVLFTQPVNTELGDGLRLRIAADRVLTDASLGVSIAVNGSCLTLIGHGPGWWETDVSAETLLRTNIGRLAVGDRVNLERPMQLGDRLGGHMVLGHIDAVGTIVGPAPDLVVRIPPALMRYLVEKGSISVDGVSLTAYDLGPDTFRVAVIPHTAAYTTLGIKAAGAVVNIEMDVLAKHVERLVAAQVDALASSTHGDSGS